jgi:hypothetical protein
MLLRRAGTTIRDLPEHGLKVGFVADPEGHLIELFSRYG